MRHLERGRIEHARAGERLPAAPDGGDRQPAPEALQEIVELANRGVIRADVGAEARVGAQPQRARAEREGSGEDEQDGEPRRAQGGARQGEHGPLPGRGLGSRPCFWAR